MEHTGVHQLILISSIVRLAIGVTVVVGLPACGGSRAAVLTAEMPLHLEDHLDAATVVGSELPKTMPATVEWRFDQLWLVHGRWVREMQSVFSVAPRRRDAPERGEMLFAAAVR